MYPSRFTGLDTDLRRVRRDFILLRARIRVQKYVLSGDTFVVRYPESFVEVALVKLLRLRKMLPGLFC